MEGTRVPGRDAIIHKTRRNGSHEELVAKRLPLFSTQTRIDNTSGLGIFPEVGFAPKQFIDVELGL